MLLLAPLFVGCSDFYMPITNTSFRISVRTMDLGLDGGWNLTTVPRGLERAQQPAPPTGSALAWKSKYGYVGFAAPKHGFPINGAVGEALNEAGLSCGALALTPSKMTEASATRKNLHFAYLCQWAAEMFSTVADVRAALEHEVQLWGHGTGNADYTHWVLRDASGASLVVETPADGTLHLHDDPNDGMDGFGIMTNEPPFEYHTLNAKHLAWKRTLARQAVPVPGSWYPEDRFMRVLMVKETMPPPVSLQAAVAQAVGTLNTITVPMGAPPGTDSGVHSAEMGLADHSLWGVVRDHAARTIYWRSAYNPSLQRLRLSDVDLSDGAPSLQVAVAAGPWFQDAVLSRV